MQKLPVIRHLKHSDFQIIDVSNIVKIELGKNKELLIHTKDDKYFLYPTLASLEELLFEDGFRMIDSFNIVNMNHVTEYNPTKGTVYLGNPDEPITKTASAARIHRQHIQNILRLLEAEKKIEMREMTSESINHLFHTIMNECDNESYLRSYATLQAVNERRKAENKIQYMAYHDDLTHLPNRLHFYNYLNDLLAKAKPQKFSAVMFMDLDRFKVINDTLGHHVGDLIIQHIAKLLLNSVEDNDMVARFGGDEFLILLTEREHIEDIVQFANRIPELLKQPFYYDQHKLFTSASIGISVFQNSNKSVDSLIKQADTAMYMAKEAGGNNYQIYNDTMNFRSIERLNMETDLRFALERGEIKVFYQPLIDLKTNKVFGMEALMRWEHPVMGWVSPAEFIPLAEETGLIIPIGNYVLMESCRQNKAWTDEGLPDLTVAVNISVSQIHQPNFLETVSQAISQSGINPNQVCLEITENVAMKNIPYLSETMDKLKDMGIKISIDDFGTGYSSLNYLKRFQVHTLKIDQSFIKDINYDDDNAAIVTALIAMSRQLKIKSLAEGVETEEQLQFLRQQGCDEIQGFIYSKALCPAEFEQLIREQKPLSVDQH